MENCWIQIFWNPPPRQLLQWVTAASTFVYFTQLLPSGGAFLAEMAGQQIGLNGSAKKLVQKRPVGGTKCVK